MDHQVSLGCVNVFQVVFYRFLALSSAVAQRLGKLQLPRLLQIWELQTVQNQCKDKFLKGHWKLFLVGKDILYWNKTKEQPQHYYAN